MIRTMEFAAILLAVAVSPAFAQERQNQPAGTQGVQQHIDTHVANCLLLGNMEEITICRFALDKIDNDEVKSLAKEMIDDHEKFANQVRRYASKDQSFELRSSKSGDSKIRQVGGTREEARPARNDKAMLHERLAAMEHQAAQECVRLTEECLNREEGKHFDQAFLGQQIGAHIAMLAKLKAAEDDVSPELRKLVMDGEKATKEHKQRAEKLVNKLADRK
jgi:predicted outer membrane protein